MRTSVPIENTQCNVMRNLPRCSNWIGQPCSVGWGRTHQHQHRPAGCL